MHNALVAVALVIHAAAASALFAASADPAGELIERVAGAYTDSEHTLRLAAMPCAGHDLCLYVELTRRGEERHPARQMVWTLDHLTSTGADAAVFLFPPRHPDTFMTNLADAAVGLWAAPGRFPVIDLDSLLPAGRSSLQLEDDGWSLRAPDPLTVHRRGARALTLTLTGSDDAIDWSDAWLTEDGARVDTLVATLRRTDEPATVEIADDGLVIIDLRAGHGPPLEAGDAALINFDVLRFNGQIVDSTWLDSRHEEMMFSAPGNKFLGFQRGVLGMRAPFKAPPESGRHLRRLIVPPTLAFGSKGRKPIIDPDEPLIVDIELLTTKKNTKQR